jgi:hypothetical protein
MKSERGEVRRKPMRGVGLFYRGCRGGGAGAMILLGDQVGVQATVEPIARKT